MRARPKKSSYSQRAELLLALVLLTGSIFVFGADSRHSAEALPMQSNQIARLQAVVAKSKLLPGVDIRAEQLRLALLTASELPKDVHVRLEDVVGKRVEQAVEAGMPLTRGSLVASTEFLPASAIEDAEPAGDLPVSHAHVPATKSTGKAVLLNDSGEKFSRKTSDKNARGSAHVSRSVILKNNYGREGSR